MRHKASLDCLLAVALVLASQANVKHQVGAQQSEPGEIFPEDCDPSSQYFDLAELKCKNCSDVMRLFEPALQEWQAAGATNEPPPATTSKPAPAQQVRTSIISSGLGSTRLTPLPPRGTDRRGPLERRPSGNRNQAEAMLSRLILANPRDNPEPPSEPEVDDRPTDQMGGELVDPFRAQNQELEQQVGAGQHARQARTWQRLLGGFVNSHEFTHEVGLLEAIGACRLDLNATACQVWSNVCVLLMYSHTSSGRTSASSPASLRNRVSAGRDRQSGRVGWQECPSFSLSSVCDSLRDWHRNEKPATLAEVADIYFSGPEGGVPGGAGPGAGPADEEGGPGGIGGLPLVPFKLDQLVQLLAYEYALDGRLVGVTQFDMRDLGRFCLFSPSASLRTFPHSPSADRATRSALENENQNNLELDLERAAEERHEIRVGQSASLQCQFNSLQANLFAPSHVNETKFVDLFVGYQHNGATFIRPVPILLRNLQLDNSMPNVKFSRDSSRWKLAHRFVPLATLSLATKSTNAEANKQQEEEQALVFAREASLEIKFKQHAGAFVINSMLMNLDYDFTLLAGRHRRKGHKWASQFSANESSPGQVQVFASRIRVSQSQLGMPSHLKDLDLVLAIVCLASCIWSLIKCYNVQKFQGLIKLDLYSLLLFLVIACDVIANLVALLAGLFAAYLFASVKLAGLLQFLQVAAVLPPDEPTELNLFAKLKLAFVLKSVGLMYKLYVRLGADLFFIDWERPKMLTSNQLLSHHHHHHHHHHNSQPVGQQQANGKQVAEARLQQQQQISFWRPYTIVNRWLQLQTLRRQNLTLQLVALVWCVQFVQLDGLSSSDARLHLAPDEPPTSAENPLVPKLRPNQCVLFRTLLLGLLYLALASVQIAYKRFVHEPMVRCRVREFLDLCSVANVSLFAMLYPRFGFYLHGRNANGSADCGIAEMNVLLEREERDLCSKRGLLPNSDQQTFVMVLPRIINDHYRKLLFRQDHAQLHNGHFAASSFGPLAARPLGTPDDKLAQPGQQTSALLRSALSLSPSPGPGAASSMPLARSSSIESVAARNRAINTFLVNFLEHTYRDIDYSIRERRRFEGLLMELDLNSEDDPSSPGAPGDNSKPGVGGLVSMMMIGNGARAQTPGLGADQPGGQKAATLYVDRGHSFASLLWLGLEGDLLLAELLLLLHLELLLGGQHSLALSASLLWLANKLFEMLFCLLARKNLVTKSMLDEKFLIRK